MSQRDFLMGVRGGIEQLVQLCDALALLGFRARRISDR